MHFKNFFYLAEPLKLEKKINFMSRSFYLKFYTYVPIIVLTTKCYRVYGTYTYYSKGEGNIVSFLDLEIVL